jgi:hypothetical protein
VLAKVFIPGDSHPCPPQLDFRAEAQRGLNRFESPEFNSGAVSSSGGVGDQVYPPTSTYDWSAGQNPSSGYGYVQSISSPVYEPNYGLVDPGYFGNGAYVAPYTNTNAYGLQASNSLGC